MFQFTRFASHTYEFSVGYPCGWVSPFRNLRVTGYLPPLRSLSQAITSFVAYHCQGIQHMLLFTWPYNFDVSFETLNLIKQTSRVFKLYALVFFAVIYTRIQLKLSFDIFENYICQLLNTNSRLLCSWIRDWRNQKAVCGTVLNTQK